MSNVLQLNGLSEDILKKLSYKSNLGISLKRNLHYFNKDELIDELIHCREWYFCNENILDLTLDFRIKSIESIIDKYNRYYPSQQTRKVFNDILGMRAFCDDYTNVINLQSDIVKIADMSHGKANDDGYRGIHIYYQLDNFHYPIEIQFNTLFDRQLNDWLHDYLYKKPYPNSIGKDIREKYEKGLITNINKFEEVFNESVSSCEKQT